MAQQACPFTLGISTDMHKSNMNVWVQKVHGLLSYVYRTGSGIRDVFLVTGDGFIWEFSMSTGHLVPFPSSSSPTSIATVKYDGLEAIIYGNEIGELHLLDNLDFDPIEVSPILKIF